MAIRVICPGCGATIQAPNSLEGSEIECAECGGTVLVRRSGIERRSFGRGLGRGGRAAGEGGEDEYEDRGGDGADGEDAGMEEDDGGGAVPPRRAPLRRPFGRPSPALARGRARGPSYGTLVAIAAGAFLLLVSVLLPWATASGPIDGKEESIRVSALEHWGGVCALIAAIAGAALAIAAWFDRRIALASVLPAGAAVAGAVACLLAFSTIPKILKFKGVDPGTERNLNGGTGFGAPLALLGAFLMAAGGVAGFQEGQRLARRRAAAAAAGEEAGEEEDGEEDGGEEAGEGPIEYDHEEGGEER